MQTLSKLHRSFDSSFWRGLIAASFLSVALAFAIHPAQAHGWHHRYHHHHHRIARHWHRHHWRHHYRRHWHRHYSARALPRNAYRYEARVAAESSDILATAERYLGDRNFTRHRGIPWCAAALGKWLYDTGYARLSSLRAIDYLHYGRPTKAHIGAIAVLPHHVGIVAGFAKHGVLLISGNHSHKVGYGVYSFRRILGFRDPVRYD